MLPAGVLDSAPHPLWDSRRLWSLADMINFGLGKFILCMDLIERQLEVAKSKNPDEVVSKGENTALERLFEFDVFRTLGTMHLDDARIAAINIGDLLQKWTFPGYTYRTLTSTLQRLRDDVRESCKTEYFFHYPKGVAALARPIMQGYINAEWTKVVEAFPSTQVEIEAGLDCFAFGDFPGCVFHMIRIAERGLRLLSWDLRLTRTISKKPIEYAMWGDIINTINKRISDIATSKGNKRPLTKRRLERRETAVGFYRTIVSDMQALHTLRDQTVHLRDKYDRGQAFTAMNRTFEMMMAIAPRLNEKTPERIKWRL